MKIIHNTEELFAHSEQDTEIKQSPFIIYPGERMEIRQQITGANIPIFDFDKIILLVLAKYHVTTSGMIYDVLKRQGLENCESKDLQHRMSILFKARYVQKAEFISETGFSAAKMYMLDYRGRGVLKAMGRQTRLQGYIGGLTADLAKKILAVNQYVIRSGCEWNDTEVLGIMQIPGDHGAEAKMLVRPQARVNMPDGTLFVEGVRRNEDWEEQMLEKIGRIYEVASSRACDTPIKNPHLILVCEDKAHMAEVMDTVHRKTKLPVKYTFDIAVYSNPQDCLYSYEPPTGRGFFGLKFF